MHRFRLSVILVAFATLCFATGNVSAQGKPEPTPAEADLAKSASKILMKFANFARGKKHGPMEKQAYDLIVSDYEPDNKSVRSKLGYKLDDGEWKLSKRARRSEWADGTNRKNRFKVQQEWRATCEKLAAEHRELGLSLRDDAGALTDAGKRQLELAILFDPLDKAAHEALGHVGWDNGGVTYYGTEADVAFMKRMKEIETTALMLAQKDDYEVKPVDTLPEVLNNLGLEMYGAKSEHFTIFTRGTQENADDLVKWGERTIEFLDYLLGNMENEKRRLRAEMKGWAWIGFIWTPLEMDDLLANNPQLEKGKFKNVIFRDQGRPCEVSVDNMPSAMMDGVIGRCVHYGLGGTQLNNAGMLEGLHHAVTWFLKSTCITKFGSEPEGTTTGDDLVLPDGANWWLREMRNQAIARTDIPLNVIPRTELWKFSADARLKSWSYNVWALARFPDKWLRMTRSFPEKIPFPEEVEKNAESVYGMSLQTIEDDWRRWASGRGVTAAATGYGPPLLPEFPDEDELKALERLNQIRSATSVFNYFSDEDGADEKEKRKKKDDNARTWLAGLPECELDSESTAACKDHAVFLNMHEAHWVWPEAHEENPALAGFSPRGMRAGLRSVIVMSKGSLDAADSVDQWIGTVYHRFPLLEYNIKRFGLAHSGAQDEELIQRFGCERLGETVVLDMGSLEEPRVDESERQFAFVAWPPHEMKNVPRQFAYNELPNPLEDVGIGEEGQQKTGYPVSLQFSNLIVNQTSECTLRLYKAKKRGASYEKGDEVPCWLHTPNEPLLKRMVMRDVVFVIPKELLEANERYLAVATLTLKGGTETFEWVFTTGSSLQGLGRLK
ncbi:MAG: hypothetical protein KDB80_15585 [Planctomycetes bacterium]|nr:hypothetical protein [Planctomycetota bacterium]